MSITYYDPIISIRRGSDTPLVEITENKKVINSVSILSEIASRTQKVSVNGTIGGQNYVFYELPLGSTPSIDTTNYYVYFTVDYVISQVNFPVELEGITLGFNFWGQGCHYFPASRVWVTSNSDGNGNYSIETTLEEMIDNYNLYTEDVRIANELIRIASENTRLSQESARVIAESSRVSVEQARVAAEAARVASGALMKSGDSMNGTLAMGTNGIIFGNIKFSFNAGLGTVDITTI